MKKIVVLFLFLGLSAQALHISSGGLGQVLLFPYYTVNNDLNSLISITNTSFNSKALRVRFREGSDSKEVFAFNLYLGPYDQWVGALYKSVQQDGSVTKIINADSSCTVPQLSVNDADFYVDKYIDSDAYGNGVERTFEGFVEVIEMGQLTGDSALAASIDSNHPTDCATLVNAWDNGGYWQDNPQVDMLPPSGGIAGSLVLINVSQGIAVSEPVTAIADFSEEILHFSADSESPNLADGKTVSDIHSLDGAVTNQQWETGFQAVSAVLMKDAVYSEYVLTDAIGANTETIITMPTRQFHEGDFLQPFDDDTFGNMRCEDFAYAYWSREEEVPDEDIIPIIGIPPPMPEVPDVAFCFAANVLEYHDDEFSNILLSEISGSHNVFHISMDFTNDPTYFDAGYGEIYLAANSANNMTTTDSSTMIIGLPVIGFDVQRYVNASDPTGAKNYAAIFNQKSASYAVSNGPTEDWLTGMHISENNIGQVLIYPYYTVNNELNTIMSVVNTTDTVKALKVRFLEGKNSRECLSFNLYLSPYDVWTSALIAAVATEDVGEEFAGQNSVRLLTPDTSCTVPEINGAEFSPTRLNDGLGADLQRCREGHLEIIDMGILINTTNNNNAATSATHLSNGEPLDCEVLQSNWGSGGYWAEVSASEGILSSYFDGITGSMSLIDVGTGVDLSFNPTAIKGYTFESQHTAPDSDLPNLASGSQNTTVIENNWGFVQTQWPHPVDAMSALFMSSNQMNNYVISDNIHAETEWVTTFPTKRFYVDPEFSGSLLPLAPFKVGITAEYGSCEYFRFSAYDRNQQANSMLGPPPPPDTLPPNFSIFPEFCWSVNVMDINQGENTNTTLGSELAINDWKSDPQYASATDMPFDSGWMQINFIEGVTNPGKLTGNGSDGSIHEIYGKPVIGMAVQKYVNGTVGNSENPAYANYGVVDMDKRKREMVITPQ